MSQCPDRSCSQLYAGAPDVSTFAYSTAVSSYAVQHAPELVNGVLREATCPSWEARFRRVKGQMRSSRSMLGRSRVAVASSDPSVERLELTAELVLASLGSQDCPCFALTGQPE